MCTISAYLTCWSCVNVFCFRDEYGKLYDFVTQKKLRVKNIGGKNVRSLFLYFFRYLLIVILVCFINYCHILIGFVIAKSK